MNHRNICKFSFAPISASLTLACFVMESDRNTMKLPSVLKLHRILLCAQGGGLLCLNEEKIPIQQGTLLFCFHGERFVVEPENDLVYLYIDFDGTRSEELFRRFNIRPGQRRWDGYDGLIPMWKESLSRAGEDTIDLASESILLYTFSRLRPSVIPSGGIVQKMMDETENRFTDPDLSISSIAESLSYNPKYLSHCFKQTMNITFSEYLRNVRIKYAITLLNNGLDSVKNVAFLSGYSDPLYFSNVFKKVVGCSPKEYIANLSCSSHNKSDSTD